MSKEDKFIEENKDKLLQILEMNKKISEIKYECDKLRKSIYKDMVKLDINNLKIPTMNIRIQICGGKGSTKIDRRKLEKEYPEAFRACVEHDCSDPYISLYPINGKLKKGINLLEVKK